MMERYFTTLICFVVCIGAVVSFSGPIFSSRRAKVAHVARWHNDDGARHYSIMRSSLNDDNADDEDESGNEKQDESSSDSTNEEAEAMDVDSVFQAMMSLTEGDGDGEEPEIVFVFVEEEEEEEDEDEDDEDDEEPDPYAEKASSEFVESGSGLDWGGALGKLRQRVSDVESGESQSPSKALFRIMTSQTPNQAIGTFVNTANPQVVAAMSGAVSTLLGGLSNPAMGVETIVKASGEKIGSLCFQLQMTG